VRQAKLLRAIKIVAQLVVAVTEGIVYVGIPTLPLITRLPTKKQRMKILKRRDRQGFGENIGQLVFCINPLDANGATRDIGAKMMIFEANVFGPGAKFWS